MLIKLPLKQFTIPLVLSSALLSLCAHGAIHIEGIDSDLATAIKDQSPLKDAECDAPDWWLDKQLHATVAVAGKLLETQGHYQPHINPALSIEQNCWQARIDIDAGSKAKIRHLDLRGLAFLKPVLLEQTLQVDTVFTHKDYESFKSEVIDAARSQGYLDAKWLTSRVTINLPSTATEDTAVYADIELQLDAGPQYVLGEITQALGHIQANFINKFHDLKSGQAFVRDDLDTAYRHLNSTGYFSSLNILPNYDDIKGLEIPLTIEGTLARKRTYEIGVGYATDSGPRARGEINWRRINSRGDRARVAAVNATHNAELSMEYRRADEEDPRNRWTSYIAAYEFDQPDTYRREKTSLTANQYHRTNQGWTRNNVIQYSNEIWRIGDTLGDTQLLSIGQGYQRSQGEGKGRLNSGISYTGSWRAAAESLGSDIDVFQLQIATKRIKPINNKWRLLLRGKVGLNLLDDINLLPPDLRFYAGGDNSIRGYDLDTIGETITLDDKIIVIGGKRLIEASLEADYTFRKNWSAAVFIDSGSAFNDSPSLHTGVGAGVRWYSPLGPIKIDLARGFDGLTPGWRLHISFGAEL